MSEAQLFIFFCLLGAAFHTFWEAALKIITILKSTKQEYIMAQLSQKDSTYRDFALQGNMFSVVLKVGIPLAIFQVINSLFNLLDGLMAANISSVAVSTVTYLAQILYVVQALGVGLAAGSAIKISEAYGRGDYDLVKTQVSSLLALCALIAVLCSFVLPFSGHILHFFGTPESFIALGTTYFNITLVSSLLSFFNSVYIAIQRSRGKSTYIMILNMSVVTVKLTLTAIFIYGLKGDINMLAWATLIAQGIMFVVAIVHLSQKNNIFSFSFSAVSFKRKIIGPMLHISFPVIIERMAFQFGKTIINSMSKEYGETTVGALSISNNLNGLASSAQGGFQDGGSALIGQNRGGGKLDRTLQAFYRLLIINATIGFIIWGITNLFIGPISYLFASSQEGFDADFQRKLILVFRYDSFGSCVPLGVHSAIMALLFGFGATKITLLINFCRVFVFRIPVLWYLQHFTNLGSESTGIVMAVSNVLTMIMSSIIAFFVIRKIKRKAL